MEDRKINFSSGKPPGLLQIMGLLLFFGFLGLGGWLYQEGKLQALISRKSKNKPAIISNRKIYIHITGGVKKPGLYAVAVNTRVGELIENAGGLTSNADISGINLAEIVQDGRKIVIPARKNFLKRLGIGKAPKQKYIIPPIKVKKEE